jgi:DNA polymerase-3 subunit delta
MSAHIESQKIISDLKKKVYKPIYLLYGDEPYYIEIITKYIIDNVLTEEEKAFNQTILYGKDTDIRMIDNEVRKYPMMSEYRLVVVKEAEHVDEIEKLEFYTNKPSPNTILVLNFNKATVDSRKKFFKGIKSNGIVFQSAKIRDYNIHKWVETYLKTKKYTISKVGSQMIADALGQDLKKIVNELNKLFVAIKDQDTHHITEDMIEEYIGISKDFNVFELTKAIGTKNSSKTFRVIKYFAEQDKTANLFYSISVLYNYFSKILKYHYFEQKANENAVASYLGVNPFFVKEYQEAGKHYSAGKVVKIISDLREYDAKGKGVNNASTNHYELFKELAFKILN